MSTQATIRFCDGNEEVGAIVLNADGYPEFARDKLLATLADDFRDGDADDAMAELPFVLAAEYGLELFSDDVNVMNDATKWLSSCFDVFPSFAAAAESRGNSSYQYTVHVVNGEIYF